MFSGIVQELGTVVRNAIDDEGQLRIASTRVSVDLRIGDSVAVDGCCLTVVDVDASGFAADVMPETARRTTLGTLRPGDRVDLEASLALGDRVGGHMVTGHVDGTAVVRATWDEDNARWIDILPPSELSQHLVAQGCVALDGISLTVVETNFECFRVSLIPHTLAVTRAGAWIPGSRVNLEIDLVAKHVEAYVRRGLEAHLAAAHGSGVSPR